MHLFKQETATKLTLSLFQAEEGPFSLYEAGEKQILDKLQPPIGQSHPWNPALAPFTPQAHLFSALQMLYKHSFV